MWNRNLVKLKRLRKVSHLAIKKYILTPGGLAAIWDRNLVKLVLYCSLYPQKRYIRTYGTYR